MRTQKIRSLESRLGSDVRDYMRLSGLKSREVALSAYREMGSSSYHYASSYLTGLRMGSIYGNAGGVSSSVSSPMLEEHLRRNSILLWHMNVPEKSPIIRIIRQLDSRFVYPPKSYQ